jgi:hypothetical protein
VTIERPDKGGIQLVVLGGPAAALPVNSNPDAAPTAAAACPPGFDCKLQLTLTTASDLDQLLQPLVS